MLESAGSRVLRGLYEQGATADGRVSETNCNTRHGNLLSQNMFILGTSEGLLYELLVNIDAAETVLILGHGVLIGNLPAHRADLPLEVAHATLSGVAHDDTLDGFLAEADLLVRDAILSHLLRNQILVADGKLLFRRVARHLDDLHAVK